MYNIARKFQFETDKSAIETNHQIRKKVFLNFTRLHTTFIEKYTCLYYHIFLGIYFFHIKKKN